MTNDLMTVYYELESISKNDSLLLMNSTLTQRDCFKPWPNCLSPFTLRHAKTERPLEDAAR